jgi:hypothetical protein
MDISKPPPKLVEPPYIYMHISYNKHPKGEARGLDPGTSPIIYALTIALPTTRPNDPIVYNPDFYLKIEIHQCRGEARDGTTWAWFTRHFFGINCRLQGTKTETKFLLGLGVPESD